MEEKKVYAALKKARAVIEEKGIKKNGENKFSHFKFYQLDDILKTVIPVCDEYNLLPLFSFYKEKSVLRVISTEDYSEEIFEIENDIEWIEASMGKDRQSVAMQPVQRLGSVTTYMRRYLFLIAFEIAADDEIDGMPPAEPAEPEEPKVDPEIEKLQYEFKAEVAKYCRANPFVKAMHIYESYKLTDGDISKEKLQSAIQKMKIANEFNNESAEEAATDQKQTQEQATEQVSDQEQTEFSKPTF